MQDKDRIERALIGLILGFVLGSGISYLFLLIYNWFIQRIGKEPVAITFAQVIPLGILMALSMAINMMNPPFGD